MKHLVFISAVFFVLSYALWRLSRSIAYKITFRQHSCLEPPRYPHIDPFLGLDYFIKFMNAFKGGYLLDFTQACFKQHGKTFTVNSFGTKVFKTIDPEVSKAVHATHFVDFGLQGLRYDTATHLWGNGIIVVDGPHWKRGRALMKSSFDVVHLANVERLRQHTDTFLELLPSDASTVDLAPLFKRLVSITVGPPSSSQLCGRS